MNDPEKTTVRSAWLEFGTGSAKNMDNEGGRPFSFPGKVPGYEKVFPDVDRVNPEYFKYLDRKIDYLNAHGFVPFIEVSRRDASELWKKYYSWPDSYARFIQYIFSRYQANNTVLSPIHLDIIQESITVPDFLRAIDLVLKKYGPPPFGNLLSANANPSTLVNWGDNSWVTLHQVGNKREHEYYWYMTEIFRDPHTHPALNGEPYYSGYVDARGLNGGYKFGAPGGTPKDDQFVRSAMYGNFLSGGLDLSCYYQIRDYPFAEKEFAKFYPQAGVSEQERFWDRRPVYLGLFDYENQVRPAYFVFRLLERLTGERVGVDSNSSNVHGLATVDKSLGISSILLWNYSDKSTDIDLHLSNIPIDVGVWRYLLDATGPSNDDNARLRPQPVQKLSKGDGHLSFRLDPWGVTLVSLEEH